MCLLKIIFLCVFLVGWSQSQSQIAVVPLQPHNLLGMQFGKGWPHTLHVVEGHEALIRVDGKLERLESCMVTTPSGSVFDVRSPPSSKYEAWSDSCGLRIKNVAESDEGRWRLNATGDGEIIAGWTAVVVDKDTTSYTGPEIEFLDGSTNAVVTLTTLNNTYCVVTQPFSDSSLVPGHCEVTLDRATRAVQGNWNILLGLPGKVQEIQLQRKVSVEAERLDVGYIRDTSENKLHLYCDILNTVKNITFCRFQKTNSIVGYNVKDGLSDGVHSYYGDGFLHRHCGITIEQPTVQDYGTWRCSVGVQQWVGNDIVQQTPLQALISVGPDSTSRIRSLTHRAEDHEMQTVFVQESQTFTVMCHSDESLTYCWFQHPNGTSFTPTPIQDEEQAFWYTGENLQVGDCGITFSKATQEENGIWTCHMGPRETLGMELIDTVEVRVTGPLAANKKQIETEIGATIDLLCHTSNGYRPLDYCRFLTPTAVGFRIDSTVTEASPFLSRYYFMPNKSLDYGDCALTIKGVMEEDIGEWTCAAMINNEFIESSDTVEIYVTASRAQLSRAGIAGMAVGASVLVIALAGVALYKTGLLRKRIARSETEHFALGSLSSTGRPSGTNSDNSITSSEASEVVAELGTVRDRASNPHQC